MSNPLLTETPVVMINGEERNLPRLSLSSSFAIVKLIRKLATAEAIEQATSAYKQTQKNDQTTKDEDAKTDEKYLEFGLVVFDLIFGALESSEEEIYKLVSTILDISEEEAIKLPIEDIVNVGIAFKGHPDVGFFTKKLPAMLKLKNRMTAPITKPMTN